MVSRLRLFVTEHRKDWDVFVLRLTYGYNAQVPRAAKLPPFSIVLTRKPPGPATVCHPTMTGTIAADSPSSQRLQPLHKDTLQRKIANTSLRQTQVTKKAYHDKRVRFKPTFATGDYVFIELPPLTTSPAARRATEGYSKLLSKQLGPYRIISVGLEYVKLWQDGIEYTVSINGITGAARINEKDIDNISNAESRANNEHQPPN